MGRGDFAGADIPIGALIDTNATWDLQPDDLKLFEKTSIGGYWFHNPNAPSHGLLALGIISLMNHSFTPNAKVDWLKSHLGWIGKAFSISKIPAGTQIFVDYGLPENELPFLRNPSKKGEIAHIIRIA
jgi:hypothetical protein